MYRIIHQLGIRISEETSQYIATTRTENGSSINQIVSPNVINIYPEYKLQTPSKITGSLAYVFGKQGLLSFDYSVKDYSSVQFRPTSDVFFSSLNNTINKYIRYFSISIDSVENTVTSNLVLEAVIDLKKVLIKMIAFLVI